MKIKITTVFIAMLLLALSVLTAFADQEGNARWCNIDNDGCYLIEADGSRSYIYFWSEATRKHYMGDKTNPYENVVPRYYSADGKHPLEPGKKVKMGTGKVNQTSVKDWFEKTLPNGGLLLIYSFPEELIGEMNLPDTFSEILGDAASEVLIPVYILPEDELIDFDFSDSSVPMVYEENGDPTYAHLLGNIPEGAELKGYISASDVKTLEGGDPGLIKTLEDAKPGDPEESDDTHDSQDPGSDDDHSENNAAPAAFPGITDPGRAAPLPYFKDERAAILGTGNETKKDSGDERGDQSKSEDTPWYQDEETAKQIFDFMKQYDPDFQEKSNSETGTQIDFKYYTREEIIEILTLAGALDEFEKQFGTITPKSITGNPDYINIFENRELRIAENGENNKPLIIVDGNNGIKTGGTGEIRQNSNDRSSGENPDGINSADPTELEWSGGDKDEYNKPSIYMKGNNTLNDNQNKSGNGELVFSFYNGLSGTDQNPIKYKIGEDINKRSSNGFKGVIDLAEGAKFEVRKSDDSDGNNWQVEGNMIPGASSMITIKEGSTLSFGSWSGDTVENRQSINDQFGAEKTDGNHSVDFTEFKFDWLGSVKYDNNNSGRNINNFSLSENGDGGLSGSDQIPIFDEYSKDDRKENRSSFWGLVDLSDHF